MSLALFVPSFNRPHYFNRLMDSLRGQIDNVEVIVSLNGTDSGYELPSNVRVIRQRTNTGGRVQWMLGPLVTDADYLWMMGDDERILPGGVQSVLECLEDKPGLIINHDGVYDLGVPMGSRFDSYRDLVIAQSAANRCPAITAHTLCGANVFRRSLFNLALAVIKCDTMYGQHYAMLDGVIDEPVRIVSRPTFIAGSSADASIWQHPIEMQLEHSDAYPVIIYDLIEWINDRCGLVIDPAACWVPGDGFDNPWRTNV